MNYIKLKNGYLWPSLERIKESMTVCTGCEQAKPQSEFHSNPSKVGKRCKICVRDRMRAWRKKHGRPERGIPGVAV